MTTLKWVRKHALLIVAAVVVLAFASFVKLTETKMTAEVVRGDRGDRGDSGLSIQDQAAARRGRAYRFLGGQPLDVYGLGSRYAARSACFDVCTSRWVDCLRGDRYPDCDGDLLTCQEKCG